MKLSNYIKWFSVLVSALFLLNCEQQTNVPAESVMRSKFISIKPCGNQGKDTRISISSPLMTSFANMDDLIVNTWTILGEKTINRVLIAFNTHLENDVVIDSVFLNLHLIAETPFDLTFIGNSGDNAMYVQRITSEWEEQEVNWINQPAFTHKNQVKIPSLYEKSDGVVKIDITQLFRDHMFEGKTGNEFGLYIRHQAEEVYKKVYFASSDHADFNKHPELEIYYTE
jgi:hypothetical protein